MDCEKYLYFEGVLNDATLYAPWSSRLSRATATA
jgi:hypothetical protein